jgi:hypothetical protein
MPVDPGDHVIEAHAPNAKPWRSSLSIHDADRPSVEVPKLEAVATPIAEPAAAPVPVPIAPVSPSADIDDVKPARRVPLWRDVTTVSSAMVGVAGVALGAYFGLHAVALNHDAANECPAGRCTPTAATTSDHAVSSADASTASFIVGAVGLGVAAVLLVTRHASTPEVTAAMDGRGGSVGWVARF